MANATVRFRIDREAMQKNFRELSVQFGRLLVYARLRRAYLNMRRSTRRTRKEKVWKWQLAMLHARAAEMRVKHPKADVRVVSRMLQKGVPVVMIDMVFVRAEVPSSGANRRDVLLGRETPRVVEIDECPIEMFATFDHNEPHRS